MRAKHISPLRNLSGSHLAQPRAHAGDQLGAAHLQRPIIRRPIYQLQAGGIRSRTAAVAVLRSSDLEVGSVRQVRIILLALALCQSRSRLGRRQRRHALPAWRARA